MRRGTRGTAGLLAAFVAAGAALAQPPPAPPGQRPPGQPDRPLALFVSPAGEPFRGTYVEDGLRLWFSKADADQDKALNPAEFLADHMRFFRLADHKGDGQIDGPDVDRYERETVPEISKPGDPPEARRAPRLDRNGKPETMPLVRRIRETPKRDGAARFSVLNEPEPLRYADADLDFRITEKEWTEASARRFRVLDANRDGRLVPAELVLPPPPFYPRERSPDNCPWWYCDFYYMPYVYNPYW